MTKPFGIIVNLILFFTLLTTLSCFSQIKDSTINIIIPYAPANLNFFGKDSFHITLDSVVTSSQFQFMKIDPGKYSAILMKDSGKSEELKTFTLSDTTSILLTFENNGPCLFDYPKGYKPKCPFGHFHEIIPIINGLPTSEEIKLAEKGKVILAGCLVDECSPKYYCKIHHISF